VPGTLAGELSWSEGGRVDPQVERVYTAGTLLVVPAKGVEHWAATRDGDVLLQVAFVHAGKQVADATPTG